MIKAYPNREIRLRKELNKPTKLARAEQVKNKITRNLFLPESHDSVFLKPLIFLHNMSSNIYYRSIFSKTNNVTNDTPASPIFTHENCLSETMEEDFDV